MKTYHKIQTMFLREQISGRACPIVEGKWAKEEFEMLKDIDWLMTEKIDGTNIRVIWDGFKLEFKGKTDKAEMFPGVLEKLKEHFNEEKMDFFFKTGGERTFTLYGEAYGGKIQKGQTYKDNPDFILFDVLCTRDDGLETWFSHQALVEVSEALEIDIVPLLRCAPLSVAIDMCKNGFESKLRSTSPEGLVIKPKIELKDKKGDRIITKLKLSDFPK
jgi:hypothetical protein